ncbi:MAG: hypothetical protein GWO24_19245 [Akkermansiaceae bacterium]|nr:hypothetical protein [Akkermansiaceae bacterium]
MTSIALLAAIANAPAARAATREKRKKITQGKNPGKDVKTRKRWNRVFKAAAKKLVKYYYKGGRSEKKIARLQEILRVPETGYVDTTTEARVLALLGRVEWYPGQRKAERKLMREKARRRARRERRRRRRAEKPKKKKKTRKPKPEPTDGPGTRVSPFLTSTRQPSTANFYSPLGAARVHRALPGDPEPEPYVPGPEEPAEQPPREVSVAPDRAAQVLRLYTRDGGNQGYKGNEDEVVSLAQFYMGLEPADGIVGPITRTRAKELGYPLYTRDRQKPDGIDQGKYLEALGVG